MLGVGIDKIEIVKEIQAAIVIEIREWASGAKRIDKIQVVKKIDRAIGIEVGATRLEDDECIADRAAGIEKIAFETGI